MGAQTCKDCQFFVQHYALPRDRLIRVYCGHCTFSSVKKKHPDSSRCDHFIPGAIDTEKFVSKEYLSKALLDYFTKIELLPDIPDAEE